MKPCPQPPCTHFPAPLQKTLTVGSMTTVSQQEELKTRRAALLVEIDAAGDAGGDAHVALDELAAIDEQLRTLSGN